MSANVGPAWIPIYLRELQRTGRIGVSAQAAGVSRDTVWRQRQRQPNFAEDEQEIRDEWYVATGLRYMSCKTTDPATWNLVTLRTQQRCSHCGDDIVPGGGARRSRGIRRVMHEECAEELSQTLRTRGVV